MFFCHQQEMLKASGARELFLKAMKLIRSNPQFLSIWMHVKNLFDELEEDPLYLTARGMMEESGFTDTSDMDYREQFFDAKNEPVPDEIGAAMRLPEETHQE